MANQSSDVRRRYEMNDAQRHQQYASAAEHSQSVNERFTSNETDKPGLGPTPLRVLDRMSEHAGSREKIIYPVPEFSRLIFVESLLICFSPSL